MWLLTVALIIIMGIPDKAQGSPNYKVKLALNEKVVKVVHDKEIRLYLTKSPRILRSNYANPQIRPEKDKRVKRRSHTTHRVVPARTSTRGFAYSRTAITEYVRKKSVAMFGDRYWADLYTLGMRESGWQLGIANSIGACGLGQSLPCSKTYGGSVTFVWQNGRRWVADPSLYKETMFFLTYVKNRYGNPSAALNHSYAFNWY